ncbi:MAG: hypothetical protein K8H86_06045, partial [Ignavibacteriaceae bacterium]|nr:hypothetical protein [Ignavibacteriaceae bacterium]
MNKFDLLDHFDKYLSSLTPKSFTDFSERLLQKLYPQEDIEIKGSIKKNNHCIIAGSLCKPQFLPLEASIDSQSLINTDLVNFKKEIKGLSKFIYLTNNLHLSLSQEHQLELSERYKDFTIEIWNSNIIKQKLYQLSEPDLKYVISEFTM